MDVKKAKRSLLKLKHDLDERGVDFWLREGTLLAAVRDGKFFEWDKDIDLSMRAEDWPSKLYTDGWTVAPRSLFPEEKITKGFPQLVLAAYPRIAGMPWIDIMMQYRCDSRKTYITAAPPYSGSMRTEIPCYFMDTPNYIEFLGEQFRIPMYPEMVLQSIYGDWRRPCKHDWSNKTYRPSWEMSWGEWR